MLEAIKLYFIPCLINTIAVIYIQTNILNKQINLRNISVYKYIILFVLFVIINTLIMDNFIRFVTITIITSFFISIILQVKIKETIISSLIQQILMFIAELICMILFSLFSINILDMSITNFYGSLSVNLSISVILIIIYNISFIKLFCSKIFESLIDLNGNIKYIVSIFILITLNFYLMSIYFFNIDKTIIFINVMFIIIYSIILYFLLNEKQKNNFYMKENKNLINSLNEYEKMLDYQRISNHENKNQLLVIKSMVKKDNIKAINYIDEIIKEKREDNEITYSKAKRIPSGGLQGLIYQKMLFMQEKNINVVLDVNTQVRKIDLYNISSKMNYDICRIVGIILDNAIEETIKFNRKDREIIISMYVDELFFIEISNRIKENINMDKIIEKGYTTKDSGHGYGLSLLNKIINENEEIYNEIRIVNNIFTQIVKIKM